MDSENLRDDNIEGNEKIKFTIGSEISLLRSEMYPTKGSLTVGSHIDV